MQICSPAGNVSQVPSTYHHPVQSSLNSSLISSLRIKGISVFWLQQYRCYIGLLFSTTSFNIKYHIYKIQTKIICSSVTTPWIHYSLFFVMILAFILPIPVLFHLLVFILFTYMFANYHESPFDIR